MYVSVSAPRTAELTDAENCRAFSVRFAPTVTDRAAAVLAAGLGELDDDGEHVQVRVDTVRELAAGRVGPDWEQDFAAMLAYARTKGWVNDAGDRVRAHIEPI